ncbi:tripartite tricarboxylate transporter permease [Ureibacillus aquaedulcis]|uniref:Tripartite tricarboxylate transporter permease n=1 Tax=Ureibacillus aquaedulcis TaxID=3058421 RepID=A0ABT8GPY7_9BACL|nr:tripartite tricarboxylate transporter permease [Ureibacillus sp. BA0131]MDN4493490.1 tripartite tricarboxylate transporter permease [Ureibacillus sp. BA0131]
MFDLIIEGFSLVLNFHTMLLILGGTLLGLMFGLIPGLSATMAVAICLPITYGMGPVEGFALLIGLYIGGSSGGFIPSVLLNLPGTPSSVATTFDGYPMAQKGLAGRAFGISIITSFWAGLISIIVLVLVAEPLAKFALNFGPFEFFAVALLALTLISSLSEGSLLKALIAALLGLTFAFVGSAPIDAYPRFTFGMNELSAGFNMLPVLIGIFAISEMLKIIENKNKISTPGSQLNIDQAKIKGLGWPLKDFWKQKWNFIRSTIIGLGIGILPGIGGGTANLVAYGTAKKQSKYPEKFGTGIDDGVVASEASNNATIGGDMVPLISLGIPGDTVTAMLLGGLMLHGLQPGPLLIEQNGPIVYSIYAALFIANIFMVILLYLGMRGFVKMLSIEKYYLYPIIIALCVVGAFGVNNRLFDAFALLGFGILGYLMVKTKFPLVPLILGFILGPLLETNLRRGLQLSDGSFMPFVTEPISGLFLLATVLSIVFSVIKERKSRMNKSANIAG